MPPGAKLLLRGCAVCAGVILLRPSCARFEGGVVEPLVRGWEANEVPTPQPLLLRLMKLVTLLLLPSLMMLLLFLLERLLLIAMLR